MYDYIKGILTKITAKYIVVETQGVGYILQVANPYAYSGQVQQEVTVYTHQVIREMLICSTDLLQKMKNPSF